MDNETILKINEVLKKIIGITIDKNFSQSDLALNHNHNWEGTSYFCNEKKIVHFTSLRNLFSILNEKALRMYSMNHPTDIDEFSKAGRKLFDSDNIEHFKKDFFYTSFSNINSINNPIMWRLYGYNGKGVCLLFEIEDNPLYWNCFHYGKVIYNYDNLTNLKQKIDEIKGDNNNFDLIFPLQRICGFHKTNFYSHEEEIRMITYHYMESDLREDINERNEITRYFPLSIIYRDKSRNNPYNLPKIRLKQIILGYEVDTTLVEQISEISNRLLGYPQIQIQVTKKQF